MIRRSLCTPTHNTRVAGGIGTLRSRSPTAIRAGIPRTDSGQPRFPDPSVHLRHDFLLTKVKTISSSVRGLPYAWTGSNPHLPSLGDLSESRSLLLRHLPATVRTFVLFQIGASM
jgi:hypothetical protein